MGLLSRLERGGPRASITGDMWRRILAGPGTVATSGVRVTDDVALACAAVYACIRVVSEDVAKLPLILYRRLPKGGKERATNHYLYGLLHDQPNDWQTSFEWREMLQGQLELRGNAYAYVNRVRREVRELIPINPDKVSVKQTEAWALEYDIEGDRVRTSREILHFRGFTRDGITGVSTLTAARESIGLSVAAERHGSRLFANGVRTSGVLQHPGIMSDEAARNLKESTEAALKGENAHRLMLLEEGTTFNPISMTPEDSQFLQTRTFQVGEIARIWRIPPHKIGLREGEKYNSMEQAALEYITDSLMPRLRRWEQRLNRDLLTPEERREFFFEFNADALLRGDTKTRYEAHQIAFLNGFKSRNEIREQENMNPVEGGDEYRVPMNTEPATGSPEEEDGDA